MNMNGLSFITILISLTDGPIQANDRVKEQPAAQYAWKRHTIDSSSRGADGVRLADVNGDGLQDMTTGWEEGGIVRVYLNPGSKRATEPWPAVTVGKVKSPEDAVFVDLDGDGATDVVSSCEGKTRTMFVHWAPQQKDRYLDSTAWKTQPIPVTAKRQAWMFALPMQIDGRNGIDLIVSSKGGGASVGWLQSPKNPRDLSAWRFHKLYDAGWIMSLQPHDMDGDGDSDVVVSDRKGKNRGVLWLENPGPSDKSEPPPWKEHRIGGTGREVMFLDVADFDGDKNEEILAAVKPTDILVFRPESPSASTWKTQTITLPRDPLGTAKSVRVADIDLDGRRDLVFSCEKANRAKSGLVWLKRAKKPNSPKWEVNEISGPDGIKFDLIQLLDLDADGDLDVVCCEERKNLGVIWYENPTR